MKARTAILMRTKDRPFYLERGLQSVLAQTDPHWVLVIINDAGDSNVLEGILKKYRPALGDRLKLVNFSVSEGRGTGKHLNAGLEIADSEFVAIHDDDDSWDPRFLERTIAEIKNAAAIVTQSTLVTEREENGKAIEISRVPYEAWQKDAISLFRLAESLTFPPIALLFRRAVLAETGVFSPHLGPLEDWDFSLRLFEKFEVPFLEEPLAFYHQREQAVGAAKNSRSRADILYGRLDTELRNALLRKDLAEGKVGLGFLVNIAQMQGRLYKEIQEKPGQ
ncbi:MAG: glycosyltransferase family 2 protein [Bacteriovoracia bacterium]